MNQSRKCTAPGCSCSTDPNRVTWDRREFLRAVAASAGAIALQPWQTIAGPFTRSDFDHLVPADKKLRPEWLNSLTARGERTVYRGAALEKIGMPIGGIFAGQLYLGGDGKLWHWDIFNQHIATGAEHYANPMAAKSGVDQGFLLRVTSSGQTQERILDRAHWSEVSFTGEYPIGYVEYRDANLPVSVSLEAFSPFIPLNTQDSSLPATIMEFTVFNHSEKEIECELAGWLENVVCLHSAQKRKGLRRNRVGRAKGILFLEYAAQEVPPEKAANPPDIVFDDFESTSYGKWSVTGNAFGSAPVEMDRIPGYQGDVGGNGKRVVNTHASAPGNSVEERDSATGTLESRPFTLERKYIHCLIGGGAHQDKTCVNLIIAGEVVLSATGKNDNRMQPWVWDVTRWLGKSAVLQVVDNESGPWGNIGVDDIIFSDEPQRPAGPLSAEADFGTLGLVLLDSTSDDFGVAQTTSGKRSRATDKATTKAFDQRLVSSLTRKMKIAPEKSGTATFLLSWHMPNLKLSRLLSGRHYATRFDSAIAVAKYVAKNFSRLTGETRLWHDTWYDSTLPYWFLDRTFLNTSILATSTCHRFGDGRFYAWEGVGCCEGTCGHVWQYAHAVAHLFPDLERMTREKVDFGRAQQPDGAIHFRGEFNDFPAIDAQAGTILRALREHRCSADDSFLKRNWPAIKRATQWLIAKDGNGDGLIESNQHNTLDTDWFGPVAWLSGLYISALLAAEAMALELRDADFASKCRHILEVGQKNLVAQLFDDEYFINKTDPRHLDAINSGSGCEVDQVLGQSWAFQVGLPRVSPEKETRSALRSLWRYNFTPDVGPYRKAYQPGRWYAMPGEAGLLMCTFPRSDWDYEQAKGKGPDWAAGYFNECMNGFEYQVAGHMIWERMLTEGLAITRAVHDRYHASRRNPWNEVECGDHYARSMASYGVYLAACGFDYHGPRKHLGFGPRLISYPNPLISQNTRAARFKAAFSTAEGWGTYSQGPESAPNSEPQGMRYELSLKWGKLSLRSMTFDLSEEIKPKRMKVTVGNNPAKSSHSRVGNRITIVLEKEARISANESIVVKLA